MPRIVSIGEAMVEMAPTAQDGNFRMGFAGDTLNTAWYLRQVLPQDWTVDYLTAIGTDKISDQMRDFVAAAGIGTDHIARREDRTLGLYLITLHGAERQFSYWRAQSAAKTLARDVAALQAGLAAANAIYFSGVTLAILEPSDRAVFMDAVGKARAAGALVAFDSNLRPRLWASPAEMRNWIMRGAGVADIALPSFEDEATHFGDADSAETAARYAGAGAGVVVVKNGPGEILATNGGQSHRHQPEAEAHVVDTTAAGDSFNAGFLAAHLSGLSLPEAMAAGAAMAARVITVRGALIALD